MIMPGPGSRTKTKRERDMELMARMDRRGYSQYQIARHLGISQPQVCYDLKEIRKRYTEAISEEYRAKVEEKRQQLREVRVEAWRAWEKSKADARKVTEEVGFGPRGEVEKTTKTTEHRLPDPAYLKTIIDTLKQESELDGLNAPKKIQANVSVINWDRLMDWSDSQGPDTGSDEIEAELASIEERVEREAAGLLPVPPTTGVQ
jgi:predicted transcriptional regulator